ncbi:MAG: tetratricopeptide repeat protein [Alphaproteobacteria bacterium]|nr:tetratricopeptide repeat protein [Alphaproteobacteria bacterium]
MTGAEDKPGLDWGGRILLSVIGMGMLGGVYLLDEVLPGPEGSMRVYHRGVSYRQEGKINEALDAFNAAIKRNPKFYPPYFARASIERRRGEFDAAIADYTTVLRLESTEVDAFYNRGLSYSDLGKPEQALADYAEYVRAKPDDPDGHLRRAEILAGLGERDQALAEWDALIRRYDQQPSYLLARASLRRDFGDLDAGIASAPSNPSLYWLRGRLGREKADSVRALADFAQAIALKADDLRAYLSRGETLRDGGRIEDARAVFEAAIARAPDNATAYQERGLLALFVGGDVAAAKADLDTAVEKAVSYRSFRGLLQYAAKQFDVPASATDDAPALAPDVPYFPGIYNLAIWRHIAHTRAGEVEDGSFKRIAGELGATAWREEDLAAPQLRTLRKNRVTWPAPIVALFAGKASPQTVRRAAETAPGSTERSFRLCAADFYVAEYQLLAGAHAEALALLRSAVADCPAGAPEATFAKAELARLTAVQTGLR